MPPVIEEAEEPLAHGIVVPGGVVPYVMPDVLGSGTTGIGLMPLVPVSVAPSGMVLPITLGFVPDTWVEDVPPLDVAAQVELGVRPPPSKVEEDVDDDVALVPPVEAVALQAELGAGPRPPGSISVAPSGTPVPFEPFVPLVPIVLSGEVAPIPEGLTAV